MATTDENYNTISSENDVSELLTAIKGGKLLAHDFKFTDRDFLVLLLDGLGIDYDGFTKNYFYFDFVRQLHISESQFGYVWISTYGLIARKKATSNKKVNACANQYMVIALLLDRAIEISNNEKVYDVDGYSFGVLNELSPALFQNIIFYIEVFCKAYLHLSGVEPPYTHKLSTLHAKLVETMFEKKHNDSLFQVLIVDKLAAIVDHVVKIPGDFKEQFVKYDDNQEDETVIIFQTGYLYEMKTMFELCNDFINDYFFAESTTHYLRTGLYQRVLAKAETDEQKSKIAAIYAHLRPD